MNHNQSLARTTGPVRLAPDDGVFQLAGEPTWIWVHTCPTLDCQCRSALILATQDGRDFLLERGAVVREAWNTGNNYSEVAESLGDLIVFYIDIDTNQVLSLIDASPLDLTAHPYIADIARRVDGDLLDSIGRLWYRGKGLADPEDQPMVRVNGWIGEMLAWNDVCTGVRQDYYVIGDNLYEADEMYCPVPDCDCGEVAVKFETVLPQEGISPGLVMIQQSGAFELKPENAGEDRLAQLWAAFQQRHPNYLARFARRYPIMKEIGARIVTTQTVVRTTPKVGRNDPCPCGSGKKHKKCCYA